MAWYHDVLSRVRSLTRRAAEERELAEEMQFHLEMEARYKSREGEGLSMDEARRQAARDFGGVERYKEEVRDARGTRWLEDLVQDTRFAFRTLRRRAGFTFIATLTLALGIGATTTLFGVVKTVLLTPLPYSNPKGIAVLWSAWKGFDQTWLSYDEYEGWKSGIRSFADVGIWSTTSITLTGENPERLVAGQVGANVFPILGVTPMIGRNFTAEEDQPNGANVVILGYALWQRRFGGDPSIVGKDVQIGGRAARVIGVMPADFRLPLDYGVDGRTEAWVPLATDAQQNGAVPGPEFQRGGGSHGYYGVARLAPGGSVAKANVELKDYVARLVRDGYLPAEIQFRAFSVPVEVQVTGRIKPVLLVVFGAVGFVLLIACANVAGLLLVRGEHRRRELAVRVALGAGSKRLTRLLLTESVVLASLGGVSGVALAMLGVKLVRSNAPAALPRVSDTTLDGQVLLFALVVSIGAALLAGVLPALQAIRSAPAGDLKEGGRAATAGRARLRWRQTLVAAEVALAVVLVAGAGLMIRSVANLFAIDTGFRRDGVVTMRLSTPSAYYPDSVRVEAFWQELQRRVSQLPHVKAVGAARILPLATEMGDWGLRVDGYTPPPNEGTPGDWQVVTPGYFEAMGLRLKEGRFFQPGDVMNAAPVIIINQRMAEKYFAGRRALGGRIRIGSGVDSTYSTVVGIVDNVHHNGLTREVKTQFYSPVGQFAKRTGNTTRSMSLVVRSDDDPKALIAPLRATVRGRDARLPISEIRTMDDILGESIAGQRFAMQLLGLFSVLALVLSAIGIFGIVSQVVASRSHEFGIRAALGATPGELIAMSLRSGVRQAGLGLAVGVVAALVLTRALTSLLQDVAPTDPMTFVGVIVVTGVVAMAASIGPARRAGRADPARVLHEG